MKFIKIDNRTYPKNYQTSIRYVPEFQFVNQSNQAVKVTITNPPFPFKQTNVRVLANGKRTTEPRVTTNRIIIKNNNCPPLCCDLQ